MQLLSFSDYLSLFNKIVHIFKNVNRKSSIFHLNGNNVTENVKVK